MKCLICGVRMYFDDSILLVIEAVYNGPREDDITRRIGASRIDGAIHLECLERSGDAAKTPNTVIPEPPVKRSDALSILEGGL